MDKLAFRNLATVKIEIIVYLDDPHLFRFQLFKVPILMSQISLSRNKDGNFGKVIIILFYIYIIRQNKTKLIF